MAHSLLLLLKGPLQSWGDESRFKVRATATTPTKSGVLGLIAAAQGRRRVDPVEDLTTLTMAVRVDQSGSLLRDYQTAQPWQTDPQASAQLVTRYFLSDAAFVVALESDDRLLLEGIADALRAPVYPLFMGRRSCPTHPGLVIGIVDDPAEEALRSHPNWYATETHKSESPKKIGLALYRDALPGEEGSVSRQDVPISFNPEHRQYGWRDVIRVDDVEMDNPCGRATPMQHDAYFDTVVNA
ncbi:type I-E CRISPR-associated protein Cas5/CasD [Corynebacterium sp. LK2510]|uniref:type I-E CRISPR-associated protein Cas5/CasD n=1 Tax=Corynebacterium sp. LK2510 TaxID=3110472 RepID=UPI0034CE544E